jgi:hypothetical protein
MRTAQWVLLLMVLCLPACSGTDFFPDSRQPDTFYFGTKTEQKLSTDTVINKAESDDVILTGNAFNATVTILNGEYSTDKGTTWSSSSGVVGPSGTIRVRNISAKTFSTATVTTISIQDVVATFTSVTKAYVAPTAKPLITNNNSTSSISIPAGTTINLDGSSSVAPSLPDGATIRYKWTLQPAPTSAATLSSQTSATTSFTTDVVGTYIVQLVVNDTYGDSPPVQLTITATKPTLPVANAGPNQSVVTGATVTLDGSGSSPLISGDTLTYQWALTTKPAGSTAALSSTTVANPTFVADKAGDYIATLTVKEGALVSNPPSTVTVTAVSTPVANAGSNQNASTGNTVTLDGSASTGGGLTYSWALAPPAGSSATLSSTSVVKPTFIPDIPGTYTAQLTVSNAAGTSAPASVTITVTQSITPLATSGGIAILTVAPPPNPTISTDGKTYTFNLVINIRSTETVAKTVTMTVSNTGINTQSIVFNTGTILTTTPQVQVVNVTPGTTATYNTNQVLSTDQASFNNINASGWRVTINTVVNTL